MLLSAFTLKAEPVKQYPIESLSATITVPDDFPTIQKAVNAANPNDTVYVRAGTYNENILLNKTINLIGENPHTTIINGSGLGATYSPTVGTYGETFHSVKVCSFTITGSRIAWGIYVQLNSKAWVENNIITGNSGGIILGCDNSTVINNTIANNEYEGMLIFESSNNTLINNTISGNPYNFGITQSPFNQNIDTSNTINGKPLYYLENQTNLNINPASYPDVGFLALVNCTNITIENLTLQNNYNGLILAETRNSTIKNNILMSNVEGLSIINSPNNTIRNNNITDNAWKGLTVDHSPSATLEENKLTNNYFNLQVTGDTLSDFMHDIDTSNTADGKLMRYIKNASNLNINSSTLSNTGYLALVNCHNVTAQNFTFEHNEILAAFTTNSSIVDNAITNGSITLVHCSFMNLAANTIAHGVTGISLDHANNNTITRNKVTGFASSGIALTTSSNNTISDNNIRNETTGIDFDASNDNTVFRNNITNNMNYALSLGTSSHNLFYRNNFINQVHWQVVSLMPYPENYFDNGYPSGGNYWSDYNGTDQKSGTKQNITGSDGIGDQHYLGFFPVADNYPLMQPIRTFEAGTWQNKPRNIDITSNSTLSAFKLNATAKTVSFNVAGETDTNGFCRIIIPNAIIQDLWSSNYTITVNGQPLPHRNWTDTQNTYLYINYTHSQHEIVILPEYPQATALTVLAATTAIVVGAAKKLNRKRDKRSLA
jgi:parallel beta-helix repeat protein